MDELEVKKFYNKNKSYCAMPFKEIYGDNAGRYRFCCHATEYDPIKKYVQENSFHLKKYLLFFDHGFRKKYLNACY